jgi:hypothetical protein
MNLLLLAGFGLGCLGLLWIVQALTLLATGDRNVWVLPYRHDSSSTLVRWAMKLALQAALLSTLFAYPWAIGQNPWRYHLDRFAPVDGRLILLGVGLTVGLLTVPFLLNLALGWVQFSQRYSASKLAFKIGKAFLIPIPLTLVEEPLFRGLVQEQLLNALPSRLSGVLLAVILSSMLFASVHFLRRQKRTLLPALGLFALGMVLSLAYIRSGHNYLLPIAIHAGGVWFVQATRPLAEYRGPSWLIGYSSYPICGGMGLAMMAIMGMIIITSVGV